MKNEPETPPHHQEAKITGSRPSRMPLILTSVVSGLIAVMLMALADPHLTGSDETNWIMAISAGVLVAVGIYVLGVLRRTPRQRY